MNVETEYFPSLRMVCDFSKIETENNNRMALRRKITTVWH